MITKGLIYQKINNTVTLFDPDESVLYTLNETASYIFLKLKANWSEEKIAASLSKKYGISQNASLKDIRSFTKELEKSKFIAKNGK